MLIMIFRIVFLILMPIFAQTTNNKQLIYETNN